MTTVFVTGGAGYIGSVLVRELLNEGFRVICLDRLFFGIDSIKDILSDRNFVIVHDDVRWFDPIVLRGVDVVIDMAAIANDPAGELNPAWTMAINYEGRVRVANLAKKHGVKRYILFSSCSVYGFQEHIVNEESKPNPLTTYAKANLMAEQGVLPLADEKFTVTVLRLATVYGYSPRTRLDLVVNAMTYTAFREGKIIVEGDGMQKRPLVHVKDVVRAVKLVMESDPELVNGQIFNVGSNEQNYRIIDIANEVRKAIGRDVEIVFRGSPDRRSYWVDFTKIRKVLGFEPKYTVQDGAREIWRALETGELRPTIRNWTVKTYKYLIETWPEILDKPLNIIPSYWPEA